MRRGRRQLRWQKVVLLNGSFLTLLFTFISVFQPSFLSLVGLKVYDSMVRFLPKSQGRAQPVIIDLDEKTLAQFGQWPWPRYRTAQLLKKLNQLEPSAVGLDIIFAEPDRTSLKNMQQEMLRDLGVNLSYDVPAHFADNDFMLARSLEKGPFVLGYKFLFGEGPGGKESFLHRLNVSVQQNGVPASVSTLYQASDAVVNIEALSRSVNASGFVNYPADEDGVLRRVPLLIAFNNEIYPSFALATLMKSLDVKRVTLNLEKDKVESLEIKGRTVPLDQKSNLLLDYQGGRHFFDYIAAADILNDAVARERIKNKIILVGTSAAGLVDTHATPLDTHYPGVEVHATIIENIVNNHFFARPLWARGAELLSIIALGFFSTLFLARARPLHSIIFLTLAGSGLWTGSYLFLSARGIFLNPLNGTLILIINFAFLSLLKYWREEQRLKKRTQELIVAQDTAILSLTSLAETRDEETGAHIMRTQHYVRLLAEELAKQPKFQDTLDSETIDLLFRTSPLHDIGKVGVADSILLSPDKLSSGEFEQMKEHARLGHDTLEKAEARLADGDHAFLRMAREIAHYHHEKWDGTGYPQGLKGDEIPLPGRLMALADVYDALISRRRYKPPFSHKVAVNIIRRNSGTHFDPDVVDAFLAQEETFRAIALWFSDSDSASEVEYGPYKNRESLLRAQQLLS